jgi:hypothetical protein
MYPSHHTRQAAASEGRLWPSIRKELQENSYKFFHAKKKYELVRLPVLAKNSTSASKVQ